jgi:tetratricopeptide (TPR) repeat protein
MAYSLKELGQFGPSIVVWDEVVQRFGGDEGSPVLRALVEQALGAKAELLGATGQHAEAIVLSDALIARIGDEADPKQLSRLADGLAATGAALIGEGRYEEAIVTLDELVDRFQAASEPELRRPVALALTNKVMALGRLGCGDEAERVFEDLVTRFGEEALVMFDESAKRFANASEPAAREQVASALYRKAWVLGDLGRKDEALSVLDELIARFEDDENANIQNVVSGAHEAREEMGSGESE